MIQKNRGGVASTVIGLVMLAVLVFISYFFIKGFIWFLLAFAWVFLIVAAIIDYKVIINYGRALIDLVKKNPLYGIGAVAFTGIFYPLVFFILMIRSFLSRFVSKIGFEIPGMPQQTVEDDVFVDYEEIEDETLELERIEILKKERR